MTEVTVLQVQAEVRKLAQEQPDFVYKRPEYSAFCLYVHETSDGIKTPGCIVGHALHRLGFSLDELEIGGTASEALERLSVNGWDKDVVTWITRVQGEQDMATPWGRAVALVDAEEAAVHV
jgi:hypothetical protein